MSIKNTLHHSSREVYEYHEGETDQNILDINVKSISSNKGKDDLNDKLNVNVRPEKLQNPQPNMKKIIIIILLVVSVIVISIILYFILTKPKKFIRRIAERDQSQYKGQASTCIYTAINETSSKVDCEENSFVVTFIIKNFIQERFITVYEIVESLNITILNDTKTSIPALSVDDIMNAYSNSRENSYKSLILIECNADINGTIFNCTKLENIPEKIFDLCFFIFSRFVPTINDKLYDGSIIETEGTQSSLHIDKQTGEVLIGKIDTEKSIGSQNLFKNLKMAAKSTAKFDSNSDLINVVGEGNIALPFSMNKEKNSNMNATFFTAMNLTLLSKCSEKLMKSLELINAILPTTFINNSPELKSNNSNSPARILATTDSLMRFEQIFWQDSIKEVSLNMKIVGYFDIGDSLKVTIVFDTEDTKTILFSHDFNLEAIKSSNIIRKLLNVIYINVVNLIVQIKDFLKQIDPMFINEAKTLKNNFLRNINALFSKKDLQFLNRMRDSVSKILNGESIKSMSESRKKFLKDEIKNLNLQMLNDTLYLINQDEFQSEFKKSMLEFATAFQNFTIININTILNNMNEATISTTNDTSNYISQNINRKITSNDIANIIENMTLGVSDLKLKFEGISNNSGIVLKGFSEMISNNTDLVYFPGLLYIEELDKNLTGLKEFCDSENVLRELKEYWDTEIKNFEWFSISTFQWFVKNLAFKFKDSANVLLDYSKQFMKNFKENLRNLIKLQPLPCQNCQEFYNLYDTRQLIILKRNIKVPVLSFIEIPLELNANYEAHFPLMLQCDANEISFYFSPNIRIDGSLSGAIELLLIRQGVEIRGTFVDGTLIAAAKYNFMEMAGHVKCELKGFLAKNIDLGIYSQCKISFGSVCLFRRLGFLKKVTKWVSSTVSNIVSYTVNSAVSAVKNIVENIIHVCIPYPKFDWGSKIYIIPPVIRICPNPFTDKCPIRIDIVIIDKEI